MAAAAEAEGRPEAEQIAEQLKELEEAWARLQEEMARRRERLNGSSLAQQYYNDADEAEAWIGEQELYMIADEKAKVRSKTLHIMWRKKKNKRHGMHSHDYMVGRPRFSAFESSTFHSELGESFIFLFYFCVFILCLLLISSVSPG